MPQSNLYERYGRTYRKSEVVFREGDWGNEMFIIQSGRVKITKRAGNVEKTLMVLKEGDFFGEMAIVENLPRSASVTAVEPARILTVNEKTFASMIQNNTNIAMKMITKLCGRLREANRQIEELIVQDKKSRIISGLLRLAETRGSGTGNQLKVRCPSVGEELSGSSGVEPNEVMEILRRLEHSGLAAVAGDEITILNRRELEKFRDFLEMKGRLSRA